MAINTSETKRFSLRAILTVTTGRLLTESRGPDDNGIGDLYALLSWMTDESVFTHQLGRFGKECRLWLIRWFPELNSALGGMDSLDRWIKCDTTSDDEGIRMWIVELKMMHPAIKDEYDVPRIPADDHERRRPLDELVAIRGTAEGVVVVETSSEEVEA